MFWIDLVNVLVLVTEHRAFALALLCRCATLLFCDATLFDVTHAFGVFYSDSSSFIRLFFFRPRRFLGADSACSSVELFAPRL